MGRSARPCRGIGGLLESQGSHEPRVEFPDSAAVA